MVRLYLQMFVGGLVSYLRYFCFFAYSGVQDILCCVFLLYLSSSCFLYIVVSNTYCILFLLCFFSSWLPVSLDCPFLIAPSIYSNVYL